LDISKLHDGDVREAMIGLGAALSNSLPLFGTIEAVARNLRGRVPSTQTDGGCHEVDHTAFRPENQPGFFLSKERTPAFPARRTVALRVDSSRPVIDQLRAAVAKIEART
jgi:hypothetical protein